MPSKVLIIGSSGYIGGHLFQLLNSDSRYIPFGVYQQNRFPQLAGNHFIGDITSVKFLEEVFKESYDTIFLCHGISSPQKIITNPNQAYQVNVESLRQICSILEKKKVVSRILFLSSRQEYGRAQYLPVDEQHPLNPLSEYGRQKQEGTRVLQDFAQRSHCSVSILRLPNIYGGNSLGEGSHNMLHQLVRQALREKEITVFGNGNQLRDYLHISDFMVYIQLLLSRTSWASVYNVGSGKGTSFLEMAQLIAYETGAEINNVDWDSLYQEIETGDYVSDINLLQSHTNYVAQTSLAEGIKQVVKTTKELL